MDLNSHITQLEKQNRKMFGAGHFFILCLTFSVIILTLLFYTKPVFAIGASGFVAFLLHYFYAQMAFKKLNSRITLLQTKIEQSGL
ncbi:MULTISPECIES: hypothetical protein [Colwellia]|uniref:2TM domain-containing protein n=1 Tax=Colwellia marinimaniae TaxID=1513592 RepID=A0ABQ0MYI6_9GAMM|nr:MULTISPECIES: hypothetical protein [Colwellia]GAW97433.1 hypothetical protein MTCD1_03060 [Colwellia marinimaniae]